MTENTQALSDAGVSIWLDDLSRGLIESGRLQGFIDDRSVVGVTTNPSIFAAALQDGEAYEAAVRELAASGTSTADAITALTTTDVASACAVFRPIYEATGHVDGRVSIEVEPGLAFDIDGTVEQAVQLHERVGHENVLIKIPATAEGIEAIAAVTAKGISVNVTLIFSLERYREVINAYLTGLERAREAGIDVSTIHSVASFFVSRVDSEIDKRLDAIGTDEALSLKGKAGVANARLAYQVWQESFSSERAQTLFADGANTQRPLWASTGVKDPAYPDTLYVTELVAHDVVNTMPEKTLEAVSDHGVVTGDTIAGTFEASHDILDAIEALGISYAEVTAQLEREAVDKFEASWDDLVASVEAQLQRAGGAR